MRRRVVALFLLIFQAGSTWAEEPVYFADPDLKAVVEDVLWCTDPTPADMLELTSLYVGNCNISDLTGLEHALNLQMLWIRWNTITDLSPLAGLVNLKHIDAHGNDDMSDLSPLSGLVNLETLILRWNAVSDISPLAGLTNLRKLILFYCQVNDISSLADLPHIEHLDLNRNHVHDLSPLSKLTSLKYLDIRDNPLDDSACDIHIPKIIENNPGIDFRHGSCGDCCVSISSTLGGHVTTPGEGAFTYRIGEILSLQADPAPGFVFSEWSGGFAGVQNPAVLALHGDYSIRACFLSTLETIFVDDDAPEDIGPNDATLGDPSEDGTQTHPFDSIQEAIEVAGKNATIVVRPGLYRETVDFVGKRIKLTGIDPNDPNVAPLPIIDAAGEGPAVTFARREDPNCSLTGFVITRGHGHPAGAVYCKTSSPTIANCLIVGNRATDPNGAAIYCKEGQPVLVNCTVADNVCGQTGAGVWGTDSTIAIVNSIFWNNAPTEIQLEGDTEITLAYSDVAGGWPGVGNMDTEPLFVREGCWVGTDDPNGPVDPENAEAVWVDGDYHLQSPAGRWSPLDERWFQDDTISPCIDAGDPNSPVGYEPAPNGAAINIGAFGGMRQASVSDVPQPDDPNQG